MRQWAACIVDKILGDVVDPIPFIGEFLECVDHHSVDAAASTAAIGSPVAAADPPPVSVCVCWGSSKAPKHHMYQLRRP